MEEKDIKIDTHTDKKKDKAPKAYLTRHTDNFYEENVKTQKAWVHMNKLKVIIYSYIRPYFMKTSILPYLIFKCNVTTSPPPCQKKRKTKLKFGQAESKVHIKK